MIYLDVIKLGKVIPVSGTFGKCLKIILRFDPLALWVKFCRRSSLKVIDASASMKSQVIMTENLSVLDLFRQMIIPDYTLSPITVTKIPSA